MKYPKLRELKEAVILSKSSEANLLLIMIIALVVKPVQTSVPLLLSPSLMTKTET